MSTITILPAKFESKYQIAPNEIIFDRGLSDAAKILILAIHGIKSCAPSWVIVQADLQKRLSWGRDKMRSTMKELEHYGFLKVVQDRKKDSEKEEKSRAIKGSFRQNDFFFSMDKEYKDEKNTGTYKRDKRSSLSVQAFQPLTEIPSTDSPLADNRALPMPNKPIPDSKAMKAMPVNSSKSRALVRRAAPKEPIAKNKARLFKRPEDEEDRYQFLLSLEFGKKKEKLSDDTASYLAHSFTLKQLEDCYFDVQGKIKRGQNIRSPIAVFRTLLTDEHCPRGSVSQTNEAIAEQAKSDLQWSSLVIKDKYVFDSSNPAKDVPLNIDSESFRNSLMGLYSSLHRDYGQVSANY